MLFQALRSKCSFKNLRSISMDLEASIKKAAREAFPGIEFGFCSFHIIEGKFKNEK
jgi:hypothetical protein